MRSERAGDRTAGRGWAALAGLSQGAGSPMGERPARHRHAEALLTLAQQVQAVLVPQEPRSDYRRRLHSQLVTTAGKRGEAAARYRSRLGILIGAAAFGSVVSLAGLILALLMRSRQSRAAPLA